MSLSKKIREKKQRLNVSPAQIPAVRLDNIGIPELPLMEAKVDCEMAEQIIEIDPPRKKFDHCLFITDCKLSKKIKDQLTEYSGIRAFEEKSFANRGLQCLLEEFQISHIWIDLRVKKAREWLGQFIQKNIAYDPVIVYSGDKKQKWITEMESVGVDTKCKLKNLNKLRSLNESDLFEQLSSLFNITPPVGKMAGCLGLTSRLTKSKN